MPPVIVHWAGWYVPDRGVVYATVVPKELAGCFQWCVEVPISTLLIITDDTVLRRLLVHEFAHVFWQIPELPGGDEDSEVLERSVADQLDYALDVDAGRLVDPRDWFGPADAEDFMVNATEDESLLPFTKKFSDVWIRGGLRTVSPPLCYSVTGTFGCDKTIAKRAKEIKHNSLVEVVK